MKAVTHRLHLNVVAELLGVIPGRLCFDKGIRETPGVSLCDRDKPEVKDPGRGGREGKGGSNKLLDEKCLLLTASNLGRS